MKVVVLGAGVQGTVYGVRLARAGHDVTLVARGTRAADLRLRGASILNAASSRSDVVNLPIVGRLEPHTVADICLVTVRREQLDAVFADLAATAVARFVFMVNHANGSEFLFAAVGRQRVVLGFPGFAGGIENGVVRYVEVTEQPTAIEASAPDIAAMFRAAGIRVRQVRDMDAWLRRHAIFITAVAGALYRADGDARRLAGDRRLVRTMIVAVREGWAALDRSGTAPAPLALRAIFLWVPLLFAVAYWQRAFRSPQGELYFAVHTRHAPRELAALAAEVRSLTNGAAGMAHSIAMLDAIDEAAAGLR